MIRRRRFMTTAGAAVAASAVARFAWGQSEQVTLKLAHFASPIQNLHAKLLVPWAKKLESEFGGRIKIDLFPAMSLGGTPAQLYDQVRDGVADIILTLPGNTQGRFPGIEAFDLPFIVSSKSVTAVGRIWDEQSAIGAALVRQRGNSVMKLSEEETARWQKATRRVVYDWIKQVNGRALDGGKLIESARALISKYETT